MLFNCGDYITEEKIKELWKEKVRDLNQKNKEEKPKKKKGKKGKE